MLLFITFHAENRTLKHLLMKRSFSVASVPSGTQRGITQLNMCFLHQVCSGRCFLVCFPDTGFFLFFFCFFVMWALRTQCVNYEEPPLCPHALRQNRCVCLCVCVCVLQSAAAVFVEDGPWGTRSCWSHPGFSFFSFFFIFFSGAFLSRFPRWLCVSVWGRRLHVCVVWMCTYAKKKKSTSELRWCLSRSSSCQIYLREQLFLRKSAHVRRSTPTTCAYFRYKQIV